jgi:AraC family transcriptional regulator of adaptative response / DNA-3-methyladenine glycosylase II
VLLRSDICYRALRTHDARFDGRLFVGVSSTGIYCRPVCRAKLPKRGNCTFYSNAAAAEAAGYRPCLRCRPELAPGNANVDARHRIARQAASLIEDGLWDESGVDGIAVRAGVTARHLRRVFRDEYGVTPVAFAQTQRLLLAKRLLTDTTLPVTEIAFAAGFESLRRFNALFRERYRMSPQQLRKTPTDDPRPGALEFELSYRPPYDWPALLEFIAARAIAGVESVADGRYRRTVRLKAHGQPLAGWVEVQPNPRRAALRVTASAALAKAVPALLARLKRLFDLACDPEEIAAGLAALNIRPGLRVPGAFDAFEVAVRAVLGQQVSVAAARTLAGRLAANFGTNIETPFPGPDRGFPLAAELAARGTAELTGLGILASRAETILALARAMSSGTLRLSPGAPIEPVLAALRAIPGIGPWTAEYIAMRALAWPDAFPHTDLGVKKALGEHNPRRVLAAAEAWRPWRAYATMHLWTGGTPDATQL